MGTDNHASTSIDTKSMLQSREMRNRYLELEGTIMAREQVGQQAPIEMRAEYYNLRKLMGVDTGTPLPTGPIKMLPVGVVPRDVWQAQRVVELSEAILRYNAAGEPVPGIWLEELSEHLVQKEG